VFTGCNAAIMQFIAQFWVNYLTSWTAGINLRVFFLLQTDYGLNKIKMGVIK
jgi:hypothetical protein